jgi:hypothetical protein
MNSNILLIILCFSFLPNYSFSQQCKRDTRLDIENGPLEGSPTLDQDGLNQCETYGGSKIIDAVRFYLNGSRRISFPTSPIALSVETAIEKKLIDVEGQASAEESIAVAKDKGACSQTAVRKRFGENTNKNYCDEVKAAIRGITFKNIPNDGNSCGLRSDAANISFRATKILSKALNIDENLPSLGSEMNKICKGQDFEQLSQMPDPESISGYETKDVDQRILKFKNKIDALLDSPKPMPTVIRYCFDVMVDKDSVGINQVSGKSSSKVCNKRGMHVSAVIGRRSGPRGCQYLIFNSHGTSCNQYDKTWDCEPNSGKIWVDEENLLKNTSGITFVEMK